MNSEHSGAVAAVDCSSTRLIAWCACAMIPLLNAVKKLAVSVARQVAFVDDPHTRRIELLMNNGV